MTTSLVDILRRYLNGETGHSTVRRWLALSQWSLEASDRDLADEVDVLLVHYDDGYLDEAALRSGLGDSVEHYTMNTVMLTVRPRGELYSVLSSSQLTGTSAPTREVSLAPA